MAKCYQKRKKKTDHQMEKSFNSKIILPLVLLGLSHKPNNCKKAKFQGHSTEIVLLYRYAL